MCYVHVASGTFSPSSPLFLFFLSPCVSLLPLLYLLQTFNNWMDNTLDDLQETFSCSKVSDVEELQADLEKFKEGPLQEASTNYDALNSLVQQMADLGATENPYSTLTPQVCFK